MKRPTLKVFDCNVEDMNFLLIRNLIQFLVLICFSSYFLFNTRFLFIYVVINVIRLLLSRHTVLGSRCVFKKNNYFIQILTSLDINFSNKSVVVIYLNTKLFYASLLYLKCLKSLI